MRDNNQKVATKASPAEQPVRGACALRSGRNDSGAQPNNICSVEPVVYLVRELREAYPGKDVKVRVGDVIVVVSEPSLGNRIFGFVSGLIKKMFRLAG